ncbi:hypothetical protein EDC96DRAFT_447188 [Choanephora cucurbitarum]|nr:hypothetical protein EDC96DRAFT_447188 [Choanephora cucurbitarum]
MPLMSNRKPKYLNLNKRPTKDQKVLILTPLKNAAPYLARYFQILQTLDYPKQLISLAFLVSDTTDRTLDELRTVADSLSNEYDSMDIFVKDFHFKLSEGNRHGYDVQPQRRAWMARSRNYLLTTALKEEHDWVLWLDVDIVQFPTSILKDLQKLDVDVVVPNCLKETDDGSFWGYDQNNWQETEESIALQESLDADVVLLQGYEQLETKRLAMVDMPTHGNPLDKVPLDGVGATFTLVKANVHREGVIFPPFPYKHQVETEGFAKMAKTMGFGVYGLPAYLIYHASNG